MRDNTLRYVTCFIMGSYMSELIFLIMSHEFKKSFVCIAFFAISMYWFCKCLKKAKAAEPKSEVNPTQPLSPEAGGTGISGASIPASGDSNEQ